MRDNYDFSDAIKNPFAGKIKGKYTVTIHYDFAENSKAWEDMKKNEPSSEEVKIFEKYRRVKTPNV